MKNNIDINKKSLPKGLQSCVQIAKNYNFEKIWSKTLKTKRDRFQDIDFTLINGYFDALSSVLEVNKFQEFCKLKNIKLNTFWIFSGHDTMDTHPALFAQIITK